MELNKCCYKDIFVNFVCYCQSGSILVFSGYGEIWLVVVGGDGGLVSCFVFDISGKYCLLEKLDLLNY